MSKGVLIVEGNADVFFFDALLREWRIENVTVSPPASVRRVNGKFHAIETLSIYVKQLLDESIGRLAIVLDADTSLPDQVRGCVPTLRALDIKLNEFEFSRSALPSGGFVYKSRRNAGGPQIFLWLMPDSKSDGSLEDFVRIQVKGSPVQSGWYDFAEAAVDKIPAPLFDPAVHRTKAITSTWLAWQRYPGKGMQSVIGDRLIDLEGGMAPALKSWLQGAFQ